MMNSITRSLNIVAILTKNKYRKQFFVNKTIYSAYTCKKPFSKPFYFEMASCICKPNI